MDFHVNRKVALNQDSKYKALYTWSLQEHDDEGKELGSDQIPWAWSVVFTATEMALTEELKLEVETPGFARPRADEGESPEEEKITIEESNSIRAELQPGYFGERGARYSMFGTDRTIKSFRLWISKLADETKPERCSAWGSLSYTYELDFRNKTDDDTLQFYLQVSAARFARYVEMMRAYPANTMTLRLGMVDGLYSDWSPSISTDQIKVLTNLKDHQLTVPEGCPIKPPTLGRIGRFSIIFTTRRDIDQPAPEIEPSDEALPESVVEKTPSPAEVGLELQRAALKLAVQHGQRLKILSYAAWVIAALLALIILRR